MPPDQWRRNVWALRAAGFGHYFVHAFSYPFMPLFVLSLGVPSADVPFWSGAAYTLAPLLNGVFGPAWARLAERFGPRVMLQRSLIVAGAASALTGLATAPEHILLARAAVGLFGGFTVASIVALTTGTPRAELPRAMGSFQMSQTIGAVVGPLVGGVLADAFGVRIAFLASGLGFVPVVLAASWLYRDPPPAPVPAADPAAPGASRWEGARAVLASALPLFLLGLFILNFGEASLNPVVPLHLAALGAPPESLATVSGAVVAAASTAAALSAYLLGRLGGRFGARRVLLVVLTLGAPLSAAVALAPVWWLVGLGRVALGAVVGGGPALAYAAAAIAVPDARRATAMGFMTTGALFGLASGPVAAGLAARAGTGTIFVVNAALYAGTALALISLRRRT